jgi:sugar O-acyltransferase (sialic acid O-acetyltransferase NeuD family)
MNKPSILLLGAGGHARSCIDVIERQGKFQIAGLVGSEEELDTDVLGYPVVATDRELPNLVSRHRFAIVTVGQIKSPETRIRLYGRASSLGFLFPAIISPEAYVSKHAKIGAGTIVMHGCVVNAGASVGNNCIINSCALLEHDVTVGDNCHVSTGAILNGCVRVGEGSFVGSGSIAKQGVSIGGRCIVGMGTKLRRDIPDNTATLE